MFFSLVDVICSIVVMPIKSDISSITLLQYKDGCGNET